MIALFAKCSLGAFAVLLIALLSKTKNFYIAGLVPLFPTFSLIAHFIVGTERGVEALRATALFGLYSLIPYAGYLLAVYLFSARYGVWMTLSLATAIWVVLAAGLLVSWSRLSPALG